MYWHPECAEKYGLKVGMVQQPGKHPEKAKFIDPPSVVAPVKPVREYTTVTIDRLITTPATQKARGVSVLARNGYVTPPTILLQGTDTLRDIHEVLTRFGASESNPVMARPCPPRPRHGYLESRPVHTAQQVGQLWRATKKLDSDGEVMLQPLVNAKYSAVLTPTMFTFGKGRDGATSGKNTHTLRLGTQPGFEQYVDDVLTNAGITPATEHAYTELVWEKPDQPVWVQLRGGPQLKPVVNYTPHTLKVKHVYVLKVDTGFNEEAMLEWERLVPTLPKGTVVYHKGGNISSHAGIHCVINEVPYHTKGKPRVGSTIQPGEDTQTLEPELIRNGIQWGAEVGEVGDANTYERNILFSMFTLHNIGVDRGPLSAQLLGYAAARLFRVMSLACVGEMRHADGSAGAKPYLEKGEDRWMQEYMWAHPYDGVERSTVFEQAWDWPHAHLVRNMADVTHAMLKYSWSSSMGGLLWGRCALSALRLHEAIAHVVAKPSSRSVKYLVERMNSAVNLVHNNGSLFNKFAGDYEINCATKCQPQVLLHQVFPVLVALQRRGNKKPPEFTLKPRVWKPFLPRKYIKYADSQESLKRSYDADGSAESAIGKMAAEQIISVLHNSHTIAVRYAALSVGYAIYEMTEKYKFPLMCGECGLRRHVARKENRPIGYDIPFEPGAYRCSDDCDNKLSRYNTRFSHPHFITYMLNRASKTWCNSPEGIARCGFPTASIFTWSVNAKAGTLYTGWRPVDSYDGGPIIRKLDQEVVNE